MTQYLRTNLARYFFVAFFGNPMWITTSFSIPSLRTYCTFGGKKFLSRPLASQKGTIAFFCIQKTSNAISFTLKIRYPVSFPEVKQVKQHLSDGNSNTQQSKGGPIASGGEGNSLCKTKRLFRAVTGGSNRNEYAE